jgi:transcriptional regulator with XRE-family HTH domain
MTLPPDPALAATIRHLRHQAGLSQEDLSYATGITISTLSRIERASNNATWSNIRAITTALNIDLHQLIDTIEAQEDPPEPAPPRAASSRAPAPSYTPR